VWKRVSKEGERRSEKEATSAFSCLRRSESFSTASFWWRTFVGSMTSSSALRRRLTDRSVLTASLKTGSLRYCLSCSFARPTSPPDELAMFVRVLSINCLLFFDCSS